MQQIEIPGKQGKATIPRIVSVLHSRIHRSRAVRELDPEDLNAKQTAEDNFVLAPSAGESLGGNERRRRPIIAPRRNRLATTDQR